MLVIDAAIVIPVVKNDPANQRGQVERKYDTHTNNVH
jgi:hypothetical protein